MAIARLSRAVLVCPRGELGLLLAQLCSFGKFHPSDRDGLVQDTSVLMAASRAHAVYSEAKSLLGAEWAAPSARATSFRGGNLFELIDDLSGRLEELKVLQPADGSQAQQRRDEVRALGMAARALFDDLRRFRVVPGTKRYVMMEGYVPTASAPEFSAVAGPHLLSMEEARGEQAGEPYVPTLLVNPRIISVFERMTLAHGVPRYNEIDPTPLVALFFPLFFGMMFGDVGHGMVVLTAGWFLLRRRDSRYLYWGQMLEIFGWAAVAVGLIDGLFFGIEFPTPFRVIVPSLAISGLTIASVELLLEFAMVMGTFHLATAYYISFANELRSGNRMSLLTHLPVLTLYAGLVPLTFAVVGNGIGIGGLLSNGSPAPVFLELLGVRLPIWLVAYASLPVVLASLCVIVFGRAMVSLVSGAGLRRAALALGNGSLAAIARPFEFFVNTLSYMRLGVLLIINALFGSAISQVYGWGLVGLPLAVLANAADIALEGFIVYVQDLRLHLYEWFTKFHHGRGTIFTPLVSRGSGFSIGWDVGAKGR